MYYEHNVRKGMSVKEAAVKYEVIGHYTPFNIIYIMRT